nr:cyclopropane-fatty-acyl-phospholipid synthase family protein [Candidatus Krumholzibacteria bacterium]
MNRPYQPLSRRQRMCRQIFFKILADLGGGVISFRDADGGHQLGSFDSPDALEVNVAIWDGAFYCAAVTGQSAGVGRSYMQGMWDCDQLVNLIRIFARNEKVLRRWTAPTQGLTGLWHRFSFWLQRNTRRGARRNISYHYDLGEDYFAQFLDPGLTYSCAFFAHPGQDLAPAQTEKLDRVCRKLGLGPGDHLLEIGTGWGSMAIHAATRYGCRVTTTTISAEQARYADEKIRRLGLGDRIKVIQKDYRDLTGQYDKLVSLEMIEAVGVKYYPAYFRKCAELLKPEGAMVLQAITVDDRHFRHDARHVDFIKRYIFPGGVLPSVQVMNNTVARATDFQLVHLEEMGLHYARTLELWRENLTDAWTVMQEQGRTEEFLRCWEFYFAYCEGGFRERRIGAAQLVLAKSECRELPLLNLGSAGYAPAMDQPLRRQEGEAS